MIGSAIGCAIEVSSTHTSLTLPRGAAFLGFASVLPESRGAGAGRLLGERVLAWARDAGYPAIVTDWRMTNLLRPRGRGRGSDSVRRSTACSAASPERRTVAPDASVKMADVLRVPLHSGSRLPLVTLPDDAVLVAPPPPLDPLVDIRAAVAEAFRYPLSGPALGAVAPRGGRATIVVQPPGLPLPSVEQDPRRDVLAAVLDELELHGVQRERHTSSSPAASAGAPADASSSCSCGPTGPARFRGADRRSRLRGGGPPARSRSPVRSIASIPRSSRPTSS